MSRGLIFTLLLASVLLVIGAETRARTCLQRPLTEYSVIFSVRIVQRLPKNKMIVALLHDFRGHETRENIIIDYNNVMVWSDRDIFEPRSEWLFAFEKKAKEYDVVLCKTEYIPLQNGELSVNIDGSGYQDYTLGQLDRRLAEKSE